MEFSVEKTEEPTETPIEEDFEMADADKDGRLNLDEYKTMQIMIKARKGIVQDFESKEVQMEINNGHAFLCHLERNKAGPTVQTFQKVKYIKAVWNEINEIKVNI